MSTLTKSTNVTLAVAADITGYSKTWLLKLAENGYFAKQARGVYKIGDVVRGIIKFVQEKKKSATKSAAADRLLAVRAEEIELRIRMREGEVVEMRAAEELFMSVLGDLKYQLEGFPAQMSRDLELRRKMDDALNVIFRRTSDKWGKESEELKNSGGDS